MRAFMLCAALMLSACDTPEGNAVEVKTRQDAVLGYAKALQLTPVAYLCIGSEVSHPRRDRCDLRTKEAGVLPLVCTRNDCRLMD